MSDSKDLTAADIMTKPVVSVRPDQPLDRVDDILVDSRLGGLPVLEDGRLVGIISRSDFVRVRVLLENLDGYLEQELDARRGYASDDEASLGGRKVEQSSTPFRSRMDDFTVKDVMRSEVITCGVDAPVPEMAQKMTRHHIHRLVVIDDGAPVGIVESLDLVRLLQ